MRRPLRLALLHLALLLSIDAAHAQVPRRTENVILIMSDGLRWQEVFSGADASLIDKEAGGVEHPDAVRATWWRDTAEARRQVLMPFLWSTIARDGQIFGNREKGSEARVTNGKNFSFPGYSETLCGFPDDRIDSNDKIPNENVTVLEWLHRKPRLEGQVAAFGAWDVLPFIVNRQRCGFTVNAAFEPLLEGPKGGAPSPRMELLNRLKRETQTPWSGEAFDSMTFHTALEYFEARKPRVLFLLLGETDEWAHSRNYPKYLQAARLVDDYVRELWEKAQAMPQYRDKTSILLLPDHGRGDTPKDWIDHGRDVKVSDAIWIAAMGPDTPPLGERAQVPLVTQSQIAATVACWLGEDYAAAVPKAGKPIEDLVRGRGAR